MIYKVTLKDWERMQDLLDRNQDGEGVAKKIANEGKAVARFVAGVILENRRDDVISYGFYWSRFKAFGEVALKLGAKREDIVETIVNTEVPDSFRSQHVTKKSYTGYVGSLERLIDQLVEKYPVQIERKSINDGYNYWSWETNSSYNRNGRVWPLNYMLTIKCGDKEEKHSIIVVTNEGGGNYGYDFDRYRMPWSRIKVRLEEIVKKVVEEQ